MSYSRETWVDNSGPPFLGAVKLNTWEAAFDEAATFMFASGGKLASAGVNITFASGVISTLVPLASGGQHVLGASALMTPALASAVPGLLYVASGTVAQPTVNAPLYRSDGTVFRKIAPGVIPVVANLPANPNDGDEIYFLADAANGVIFHLRYRAASASIYKWESVGSSSPLFSRVATDETYTADSTFHDATTVGPQLTLPLAGDWRYDMAVSLYLASQTAAIAATAGLAINGAAPTNAEQVSAYVQASTAQMCSKPGILAGRAINDNIKMRYAVAAGAGTPHARWRELLMTPIRVG